MKPTQLLLALAALASCRTGPEGAAEPGRDWHAELARVANTYAEFGRVDDEARWAPWLCRLPDPGSARLSSAAPPASGDDPSHGLKLYAVWALDAESYSGHPPSVPLSQSRGETDWSAYEQVLVKEAWTPVEVEAPDEGSRGFGEMRPASRDGRWFGPGESAGLFLMLRPADDSPGTDAGWIYGTVSPGGEVTSAGLVASCMDCHAQAAEGRVFGLPKSE